MKYSEAIADIRGCGIYGRVRVSPCDGGSMVQIFLNAGCGGAEVYRVQLAGNGRCLELPDLPVCGGTGKMTYLEGRFQAQQLPGLQIRFIPRSGCGETAVGTFSCGCSDGWDFPVPPSWGGCCSPDLSCRQNGCSSSLRPAPCRRDGHFGPVPHSSPWPDIRPGSCGRKPPHRSCGCR